MPESIIKTLKSKVLESETLFQRACDLIVDRYIERCVSSLFYHLGQRYDDTAALFNVDYEEVAEWYAAPDYEDAVETFIDDADMEQLEYIAEHVGYWDDILHQAGVPEIVCAVAHPDDENGKYGPRGYEHWDTEEEATEAVRKEHRDAIIKVILDSFSEASEYEWVAREFDIDPAYIEVYEHWIVDPWFANEYLEPQGEVVFEFCNLTIWGRCTTGQSISLDGVIRRIVRDMGDDWWIWKEAVRGTEHDVQT